MTIQTESNSDFLRDYPFSLLDVDGSLEVWQRIYNPYIDLIESKIVNSNNNSITTFRNHNFAFNNAFQQRTADLIIIEEEKQISNPGSKSTINNLPKPKEKIEDQYTNVVEKENYTLKITLVLTNKKLHPLKFMQFLKLSGEAKQYAELLHKKELKQYSKVISQVIFISLFGFENSIEGHLRDNLYGKLNKNISIIVVPPIHNKLWNNFLVENSKDGNNNYIKHKSGINFQDYNALRRNGAANQFQVRKMESFYKDLKETKEISDYNFDQAIIWADVLDITNSSKLLDTVNSRKMIKEMGN